MQAQERTFLKLIKNLSEVELRMVLAIAKVQWWHKTVKGAAAEKPQSKATHNKDNVNSARSQSYSR